MGLILARSAGTSLGYESHLGVIPITSLPLKPGVSDRDFGDILPFLNRRSSAQRAYRTKIRKLFAQVWSKLLTFGSRYQPKNRFLSSSSLTPLAARNPQLASSPT